MTEGSVEIDNGGLPSQTVGDTSSDDTSTAGVVDEGTDSGKTDEGSEGEGKTEYTDKGTKLDPNPQSAGYQLLANANKKIAAYEKVLSEPDLLRKYAKEAGMSLAEAKEELKDAKAEAKAAYTPDRFKTAQDIADSLNELRGGSEKTISELKEEIRELREGLTGFSKSREVERITSTMSQDISTVQEKYPALNPKSPEYNKELESEIGSLYHELDAINPSDPNSGYKGQISLAKLTDRFMKGATIAQRKGSERAQTQVVSKQAGRIVTSTKSSGKTTESGDPGTVIAQRIAKAMGN